MKTFWVEEDELYPDYSLTEEKRYSWQQPIQLTEEEYAKYLKASRLYYEVQNMIDNKLGNDG